MSVPAQGTDRKIQDDKTPRNNLRSQDHRLGRVQELSDLSFTSSVDTKGRKIQKIQKHRLLSQTMHKEHPTNDLVLLFLDQTATEMLAEAADQGNGLKRLYHLWC